MKFKDNLYCVNCELIHWDYDKDGQKFPISYELTFKFYGTDVIAYITDGDKGTFEVFRFKDGRIIDREHFMVDTGENEEELMAECVTRY